MADATRQLLSCLPPDDEQICPPDCVLVSEDGTELPAHEVFLYMHSKALGKMLAVAKHDGKGSKRLQVSWCVSAAAALLTLLTAASAVCYRHKVLHKRLGMQQECAQLCMMLQTQDSPETLGLLLQELYGSVEVKSIIDADTVLPLLLIADKYNIKTIMSRCTVWLESLDVDRLRDTLLTTSPVKGKGTCDRTCMRSWRTLCHGMVFSQGEELLTSKELFCFVQVLTKWPMHLPGSRC